MSSAPAGNQWYFNGAAIPGATAQSYTPMQSGAYTCIVTVNGCSSAVSNQIMVVMTGIQDLIKELTVSVYPNPNDGRFTLQVNAPEQGSVDLSVVNALGLKVYEIKGMNIFRDHKEMIDLGNVPAGIYWITLTNKNSQVTRKVIVR